MHAAIQAVDTPDPESRAVQAAAGGDLVAFEQLYRHHAGRIHALCLRLTGQREAAEDCVQETFISAWQALPRFEARCAFASWLHRIAVNTVLARHRGLAAELQRSIVIDAAALEGRSVDDAPPLDLEAAIAGLPDGARHVLVLYGVYGYSHQEVAERLGIAIGTSKAQLYRARALLTARLDAGANTP